jgi:hypothetical protein
LEEVFVVRLPSQVKDDFWVSAFLRKGPVYPKPTERSGKYLLFVDVDRIDQVWAKIKKATEDGLFGDSSKCATMRRNPHAADTRVKVICVYTSSLKARLRQAIFSRRGFFLLSSG